MSLARQQITFDEGISRKALLTVRDRFLQLHQARLQRILGELSDNRQELIELLPLLFHINHPMLPGYVKSDTPKGVPNYTPTSQALEAARKLSRSFQYKRRAQRMYQLEGLYLMGSTGSIAQSSSSDFDLWLCHLPGLDAEQRRQLQQKASLIERTATEQGLELHIFLVDPHGLKLLGCKLYTALDHRPGKIDCINPGISRNLAEPLLSLHRRRSRDGEPVWMRCRGLVEALQTDEHRPIKVTGHLVEMLLWCHVNRVWDHHTRLSLCSEDGAVSHQELLDLQHSLSTLFSDHPVVSVDLKTLDRPATVKRIALFINIGTDPLEPFSRHGSQLTSNRHDPLSFAASRTNLAIHFEEMLQTSWGELLITRRDGEAGLLDALCNLLNMQDPAASHPPRIHAYSFLSVRGSQIAYRVSELFEQILAIFRDPAHRHDRYVFRLGRQYFIGQQPRGEFAWRCLESLDDLLDELAQSQPRFSNLRFDTEILGDNPYPALYRFNRPEVIQLFYQLQAKQTQIYLLDQQGALFQQTLVADSPRLMLQQRRFLNSLQQLRNLLTEASRNLLSDPEFYELRQQPKHGWIAEPRRVPLTRPDDYVELTLVTDRFDASAQPVALGCGDQEFTRLEYGDQLCQVTARRLHALRTSVTPYPIYLTSLRYSGLQMMHPPSTVELLALKKRVEQRLNRL